MRESGVKIQDLWYSTTNGKADLSRPTSRKGRGKRYRVTIIDTYGKVHTEHFATKKEAENRQKEQTAKLVTGTYAPRAAGRALFGEVAEQWFTSKTQLKGKTRESYRSLLDTQVLPKWENTAVGDIDWQSIQKWIGELGKTKPTRRKTDGLSASRVVQTYHVFRAVLSYAVRARMLPANPATDIDLPHRPDTKKRYLNHQQVADLAGRCGDWDVLVLVLAYCGLRFGEVTALTRGDVDLERGRIDVHKAVERVNGVYSVGTTKTHENREVPVPSPVLALLKTWIGSQSPTGLLFPGADGYLKNHEFRKVFDPAAAKSGVRGLSPHELRHTCASLAIRESGAPASIKTVQRLLGHKTATMTLDQYGHLYDDDLDELAQKMGTHCAYPPKVS